jgi:hypothetical protein
VTLKKVSMDVSTEELGRENDTLSGLCNHAFGANELREASGSRLH